VQEIHRILAKYDALYVERGLLDLKATNSFAGAFYADVAEVFDCITRVTNTERNPSGFSVADAPILGLLVRSWKLLKEVVRYYGEDNGEIVGVLERPLFEAVITARYLMDSDEAVLEDYRKCSYKDRLRLLRSIDTDPFLESKAGKRLAASVRKKLEHDGFAPDGFAEQERRKWKLQGKSFRDILARVESDDLYSSTFGILSESVHGSWNDSMDFGLFRNEDGTFSTYPFYRSADVRYVTPLLRFCIPAYRMWLARIDAADSDATRALDWAERVNVALFVRFDELYDE
jgi:Family of unknown function (DUF5677)